MNKYLKNFANEEVAGKFDLTTYKNVSFNGTDVSYGKSGGIAVEEGAKKTSYGSLNKELVAQLDNDKTTSFSLVGKNVSIEGSDSVGVWNKSQNGNAAVSLNCADGGDVTVNNFDITSTSGLYNCIEIGLSSTNAPGNVTIDGVNINGGAVGNNGILVFGAKNDSVITIKNVNFGTLSNPIRYSNKTNSTGVTINIVDCTCDKWDETPMWAGMIIFQDYTSKSAAESQQNNLFSADKVKVNIKNFTLNGNKITAPEDYATVCGVNDAEKQLFYVYNNYESVIEYGDGSRYPEFTIE